MSAIKIKSVDVFLKIFKLNTETTKQEVQNKGTKYTGEQLLL